MKNEILDDNFVSPIRNQLKPDEKVIWEGSPYKNRYIFLLILSALIFAFQFLLLDFTKGLIVFFVNFIALFLWSLKNGEFQKFMARKYNRYLITNERIIFQQRINKKLQYQSIPFSDISYPSVYPNMINKNNGTIFLNIKKSSSTGLILNNSKTSLEEDNRPALQMIDDIKEVGEYISKGIKGKL